MHSNEEEARAFQIALELIEEHGDDVGAFLEEKINSLTGAKDPEQFYAWFVIRNAVAITLRSECTQH